MNHYSRYFIRPLVSLVLLSTPFLSGEANAEYPGELVQEGHALAHAGKLEEAKAVFQRVLTLDPNHRAAKTSLKGVEQDIEYLRFTKSLPAICQKSEPTRDEVLSCVRRSFTVRGKPVNPRIIQEMGTWLSDKGNLVTAVNLLAAQDSNQFFTREDVVTVKHETDGHFELGSKQKKEVIFGYKFLGSTPRGVLVLSTFEKDSGGGSIDSGRMILLRAEKASTISQEGLVQEDEVALQKVAEFYGTPSEVRIKDETIKWSTRNQGPDDKLVEHTVTIPY